VQRAAGGRSSAEPAGALTLPSKGPIHEEARSDPPRRKHLEPGEPVHGVDGRGTHREGHRGSPPGRENSRERGVRLRRRLHVRAQARHQDPLDRPGGDGPHVDPRPQQLAAQRAPLRGAAGTQQEGDGRQTRREAGPDLAPELRHPPPGTHPRRPALERKGPPLRGPQARGDPPYGVPQGHGGAVPALLARDDRPRRPLGPARRHRCPRQQPACPRQVPRQHPRQRDRGAEHPHGDPPRL